MSSGVRLRPSVLAAKARLAEGRQKLQQRHLAGTPGIQVSNALTDLVDTIVLELFESALDELGHTDTDGLRSQLALVPHGGYGRRDLAPFSDVDLMLLHSPAVERKVLPLAERMLRDVYDVGLVLGHSVRTPAQACQLAIQDATICTSLVEARFLAGSVSLYSKFANRFQHHVRRHWRKIFGAIEKARRDERSQYGETVYLLEPNVKRSRGGLRDLHWLRWVGFARYGIADPDGLQLMGEISASDHRALRRGSDFLLRLRHEMHFHAGKAEDVLGRAEQMRVAEAYGFQGTEALLPVEQFMREYFRHTTTISDVVTNFVATAQPGRRLAAFIAPLLSHQVEGDFMVGPTQISATKRGQAKLKGNLSEILRLADLANLYDKRIAQPTLDTVRKVAHDLPEGPNDLSGEAIRHFLSLMAQPARLGELLRVLHQVGALERVIPQFNHARCLLQFNEYHKFTVDEHSLRAVDLATQFRFDTGNVGRVYRNLKQKRTLHLALLIHDLGKGFIEDHSELGLKIAAETGARLLLSPQETELLKFLVHKHLMMAHLAFRRDTSDDQLIVKFAVDVGSPDALQMLYLLTSADLAAVGPGVLNNWKAEVLTDLYRRTMRHLAGDQTTGSEERLANIRQKIRSSFRPDEALAWYDKIVASLPHDYLNSTPPDQMADELRELHALQPGEVIARGRFVPGRGSVEYTVGTLENITPGVFHKLTGALSSQGLEILAAQINTLADGLILDRFFVNDPDYAEEPPQSRIDAVCQALRKALTDQQMRAPSFRRTWGARTPLPSANLPTRVRTDNSTSENFTIIDVFAADRLGLLYRVTRTLFELDLSVSLAKIATHLDQVVDVFYVTDAQGAKIEDEARLDAIRARLLEEIEAIERQEAERVS